MVTLKNDQNSHSVVLASQSLNFLLEDLEMIVEVGNFFNAGEVTNWNIRATIFAGDQKDIEMICVPYGRLLQIGEIANKKQVDKKKMIHVNRMFC